MLVEPVSKKSTMMVMKKAFHCLEVINSLPLHLPSNKLEKNKVTECQGLRSEKKKKLQTKMSNMCA